jgi:two-component system CheB/CheR fusion protein
MAAKKKITRQATASAELERPAAPDSAAARPTAPADSEPQSPPVAGIGASAGGLDAFKRFFSAMPADSGIALVLVPHLDPAHESLMVELLARHTSMPVKEAADGMRVEADRVYIIPPNRYMTIADGVLRLTGPVERHSSQTSIDLFLRSLADDLQERSICIILSGTGSHGTLGLKAVKAAGGMAMVQDPATAEYKHMPQSAIATGLADYVLAAEQMPEALIQYARHAYVNGREPIEEAGEGQDHLIQVLALLRTRSQFDFRGYRRKTLARRIERRMGLNHFHDIPKYVSFLREHPEELKQLVKDLCISVTSFFRDADAFAQLASQVIAPLVESKEAGATIRVWVPGCATGEEAFSIAILLLEALVAAHKTCPLQIFATDVDEDALAAARSGLYPDSITTEVSAERLVRFFTKRDDRTYQVNAEVREPVVFAVQNLINDVPFSKLDLVSCRNLLIYLEPEVQKKVISLFHFSLAPQGFLFLGPSETIGRQVDLFEPLSKKWRIYQRIGPSRPERVDFPVIATAETSAKGPHFSGVGGGRPVNFAETTQRLMVEQFGVAAVLISRKYEILYYFGSCSRYLEFPAGEPVHDVLLLARNGLGGKLRRAVQQAIQENNQVVLGGVRLKRDGGHFSIRVTVRPVHLPKAAEGLLLVTFEEEPPAGGPSPPAEAREAAGPVEKTALQQLEMELKATREDLQSTIEEMETSNEELRSSNEEIMSMNEELQSANEELETSKEELQSLNEELTTVNSQMQDKVGELETTNNDISNLLNCTDIATVFLDSAFRIKRFTPAATRLFHFIGGDVGRPLSDMAPRFIDPDLLGEAQRVLQQLVLREKEIASADGRWWLRRIAPYRTTDNRIGGVVITFIDITERREAAEMSVRLAAIVDNSVDAIFSKDLDGIIQTWNRGAERLYGYSRDEAVGRSVEMLVPATLAKQWAGLMARLRRGDSIEQMETERVRKDGQTIAVALTMSPVRNHGGKPGAVSVIARDVTEQKQAERTLREREEFLQAILSTVMDAIVTIDRRGIIRAVNPGAEQMFGYTAAEMVGQSVNMLMPAPYREEHDRHIARYVRTGEKHIIGIGREVEAQRKDGTIFPADLAVSEIEHLKLFTGVHRDLTARKQLERDVVKAASFEQWRIGQDLHDTVGQELTALNLLAAELTETLRTDPSQAASLAKRLSAGLQRSQRELRTVLRGLLPVAVDSQGLMAALTDLADRTGQKGRLTCTFDCPKPVEMTDNVVATHLFLIGQEAVHNAVKHAEARNVRVTLLNMDSKLILSVQDDGIGMPATLPEIQGLGLRIMRNRAAIIGAQLTIEPARPIGTLVTCVLRTTDHETNRNEEARPDSDHR